MDLILKVLSNLNDSLSLYLKLEQQCDLFEPALIRGKVVGLKQVPNLSFCCCPIWSSLCLDEAKLLELI